jgi:heptosyltransferase-3
MRKCLPGEGLDDLPEGARVLIIRLRSMGDTILLTPALKILHDWRPDLKVSVLLDHPWTELLAGNPSVNGVIASGNKLATILRIRRGRFAAVINLHGGPTSAQITQFSGAERRVGMAQFRARAAYNVIVPRTQDIFPRTTEAGQSGIHTAEHAASVVSWLGVPLRAIPRAQLFTAGEAREKVVQRLAALGVNAKSAYAVIHAAALYPTKRWSAEGFARIANELESAYALRPIFLGVPDDDRFLREVEREMRRPMLRALGWPIREMLPLIAGSKLFLGNDSGPAHAAAALGVPVAVIFGSSSSALWGPWRAPSFAIIQNHFACNPCAGDRCYAFPEPSCILSVDVEQVSVAVAKLLNSN